MRVWDSLAQQKTPVRVYETPFIADVRLIAEATQKRGGVALYIARDDRHALMAYAAAKFFAPLLDVVNLPAWDCLPYDRVSPSPAISAARCAALARLASRTNTSAPMLVVTTASSLVQRVPPRSHMGVAAFVARVSTLSDWLGFQACCHGFLSLRIALRMVRSFRATAMRASFLALPAAVRRR